MLEAMSGDFAFASVTTRRAPRCAGPQQCGKKPKARVRRQGVPHVGPPWGEKTAMLNVTPERAEMLCRCLRPGAWSLSQGPMLTAGGEALR